MDAGFDQRDESRSTDHASAVCGEQSPRIWALATGYWHQLTPRLACDLLDDVDVDSR